MNASFLWILFDCRVFHTLGEVQLSLEETSYWKDFTGFIRKTCELVRYANVQGSVQNGQSGKSVVFTAGTWVLLPLLSVVPERHPYLMKGSWKQRLAKYICHCDDHSELPLSMAARLTRGPGLTGCPSGSYQRPHFLSACPGLSDKHGHGWTQHDGPGEVQMCCMWGLVSPVLLGPPGLQGQHPMWGQLPSSHAVLRTKNPLKHELYKFASA